MIKRKVCVITGARSEYGLLYPIMKKIQVSGLLKLQVIVTTMHLSEEFGNTYQQIENDGFEIDEKIENLLSSDTKSAIVKSTGLAMMLLSDAFKRLQPDVVLILGDRYETHAAATTAMLMNIPIAHIHGGEITEGAIDESIRHSITKMSYLHFVSTEEHRQRIIQMGEAPPRVFNSGAPGIDNIVNLDLWSKKDLEQDLNWSFGAQSVLFTYHPVTLEERNVVADLSSILACISKIESHVLFTYANADDHGRLINQKIEEFCNTSPAKYKVVKSLGQLRYLSAMKHVDIVVGNTSSGIIEAASFNRPVVNIGNRQKGRLQSGNVIDCDIVSLEKGLNQALSNEFKLQCDSIVNKYGVGKASNMITKELESCDLSVVKVFVDAVGEDK